MQSMIEAGVGPADVQIYVTDGFKDTVTADQVDPDNPAVFEGILGTAPSVTPPNGEPSFIERFDGVRPGCPDDLLRLQVRLPDDSEASH